MKRIICSFMAVFLILLIPATAYGNGDDWNRTIYISTPSIQEYIKDLTVKVYDGTKIQEIANLPEVGLEYTQVDAYEEIPNSAKAEAKAK